jgi:hypothetical protein
MAVTAFERMPIDLPTIGIDMGMGPRRRNRGKEGQKTYEALPNPA